jgi:hypothetical protein
MNNRFLFYVCSTFLCAVLVGPALADFEQPSVACPGAFERVTGTLQNPGSVIETFIPSGGTATCVAMPDTRQISGSGSGISLTNHVLGIEGERPVLTADFTGDGYRIINNGDLELFITGNGAEVENNAAFMSGAIFGDDTTLTNNAVVTLGMTIEGDRSHVINNFVISDGIPGENPGPLPLGVLLIGRDSRITNNADGGIAADGTEAVAAGISGAAGKISNAGEIIVQGTESVAAGIEGSGMADNRSEIKNDGVLQASGLETVAAFIDGDFGTIQNDSAVTASGDEATGMFIEGNDGIIENAGTLSIEGDLAAGMAIAGNNARLTNTGVIDASGNVVVGMGVLGTGAVLENSSVIDTEGTFAAAMGAFGQNNTIGNTGNGEITTSGAGSHGIFLGLENSAALAGGAAIPPGTAQKASGDVINNGSIVTNGATGVPAPGEDEPAGADGIHLFADNSRVANTGEITANGRNSSSIRIIGDDVTVDQSGAVDTNAANSHAIRIEGEAGTVNNTKTITTRGDDAAGVLVEGAIHKVLNGVEAVVNDAVTITTGGERAHGVALGLQSSEGEKDRNLGGELINFGRISTAGAEADGVHSFADGADVLNRNEIETSGDRASGVNHFGDNSAITNLDSIVTSGENAPGIRARGQNLTVVNGAAPGETGDDGKIATIRDGAHGVLISPQSGSELDPQFITPSSADVTNFTDIKTSGDRAHGVLAFFDNSTITNKGRIGVIGKDANAASVRGGDNRLINEGFLESGSLDIATIEAIQPSDPDGPPEGRVGVNFINKTIIENRAGGEIMAFGENAAVIRGRDGGNGSTVSNDGEIIAFGKNAVGVDIQGDNVSVMNISDSRQALSTEALIAVEGENAVGVKTEGAGAFISSRATETAEATATTGIEVSGDDAVGVEVTATGNGGFLVENAGKIIVTGINAVGMALRNATEGALSFSLASGTSACAGGAKGAALSNCGEINVSGNNSVGVLAEGVNDSSIINFGEVTAIDDNAVAIKLSGGQNGASADRNFVLNIADAKASGANSIGVSITGDNNIFVQGNDALVIPVAPNTFTAIQAFVDKVESQTGPAGSNETQVFPLGDVSASGENAVGVYVDGSDNVVGVTRGLSDFDPTGETPGLPTEQKIASVIATGTGSVGVQFDGDRNTLSNFGLVSGESFSVRGGNGKEIVIAAGAFDGAIDLGDGEDEFNLISGTEGKPFEGLDIEKFNSVIDAGAGADVLRIIDSSFFGGSSSSNGLPDDALDFGEGTVDGDKFVNFEFLDVDIDTRVTLINTLEVFQVSVFEGDLHLDDATILADEILISVFGVLSGEGVVSTVPKIDNPDGLKGEIKLLNGGKILPGDSPGILTLESNFTFGGTLEIELAGLDEGMFDQLIVDGDMTIDSGVLEILLLDDFAPQIGDTFEFLTVTGDVTGLETLQIINANPVAGIAFDLSLLALNGGGFRFDLVTLVGDIDVSEIPLPATWLLFLTGLGGAAWLRRQRRGEGFSPYH